MNVVFESSGRTTAVQPPPAPGAAPPAPGAAPPAPGASDSDVAREQAKRRPHREAKEPTTTTTAAAAEIGGGRRPSDNTRVRNPSLASLLGRTTLTCRHADEYSPGGPARV
jgi:hypothetical protein